MTPPEKDLLTRRKAHIKMVSVIILTCWQKDMKAVIDSATP